MYFNSTLTMTFLMMIINIFDSFSLPLSTYKNVSHVAPFGAKSVQTTFVVCARGHCCSWVGESLLLLVFPKIDQLKCRSFPFLSVYICYVTIDVCHVASGRNPYKATSVVLVPVSFDVLTYVFTSLTQ